jgi:hypothetical protein
MQLRVYDSVASLPSGLTNISGMGAGMICATCHNSRAGEHTDFALVGLDANSLPVPQGTLPVLNSFSAPHVACQSDVVFGFNAFFMPRYTPSAHLAVKDTCAGCHYGVATADEQAAQQTSNHSFVVDNSICAACHSSNVNGDALQSANQMQLDSALGVLASKLLPAISNAITVAASSGPAPITAAGQFVVRVYDPASGNYSCPAVDNSKTPPAYQTSALQLTTAPASVGWTWIPSTTPGGKPSAAVVLHMAAPVAINWCAPSSPYAAATGPATLQNLIVPIGGLKMWDQTKAVPSVNSQVGIVGIPLTPNGSYITSASWGPVTAGSQLATNLQLLFKAYWNLTLLQNDYTKGIHNPEFFNETINQTVAKLNTLP